MGNEVFDLYCQGLVSDRLRKRINRGKVSVAGCSYGQKAQEEIVPSRIACALEVTLSPEQLQSVMPRLSKTLAKRYAPLLNAAMLEFQVDTTQRRNMFLAQIAHESGDLRWLLERPPKGTSAEDYFKKYDGRKALGNVNPGDGAKYRGRGALQITGRANYESVGKALSLDLVAHPELLEEPKHAFRASAYWWKKNRLNLLSDQFPFDILSASATVNGINRTSKLPNHLAERTKRFIQTSNTLGTCLPTESEYILP